MHALYEQRNKSRINVFYNLYNLYNLCRDYACTVNCDQ